LDREEAVGEEVLEAVVAIDDLQPVPPLTLDRRALELGPRPGELVRDPLEGSHRSTPMPYRSETYM
jgi:hypothetical protein